MDEEVAAADADELTEELAEETAEETEDDTLEATDETADEATDDADEATDAADETAELAAEETAEEEPDEPAWMTQISFVMVLTFRASEAEQAEATQGVACAVMPARAEPHWQA